MKIVSSFVILLLAVVVLVTGVGQPFSRAAAAGGLAYPRLANVYLGGITDPASLAKWDLVIAQGGGNVSQYAPIKAANPQVKILTYVAAQEPTVQLPSPRADEIAGGFSPLWNLTRADGSLITGFGGNQLYNLAAVAPVVGGERWSDHLAAWIIAHPSGDGVFLDNLWGDVAWKDGALDLDRNGVADMSEHGNAWIDSQWEAGITNLTAKLRTGLGPTAYIVGNGSAIPRASDNGRLNEGFDPNYVPSLGGSDWATNFQDYRDWTTTHYGDNASVVLRNGSQTDYAGMRFYLGTALLSDGYFAYANGLSLGYTQTWWYDEYSVDAVTGKATGDASHKGYLGQPKGLAVPNVNGTYTRAYDGGMVIVNPTNSAQTQALGGTYRLINGTQDNAANSGASVTSLTLASRDARIVLAPANVSTNTPTPTRTFLPTLTATLAPPTATAVVSSFVMQAGDTHSVSCGNGTIASSLANGVVTATCLAPATATPTVAPPTVTVAPPTPTLTVVPPTVTNAPFTSTSTAVPPTKTATVAPPTATKIAPTKTATVTGPGPLHLGIRIDNGDNVTINAWNAKVRAGDNTHNDNANLLTTIVAGDLALAVGSSGITNGAASDAIDSRLQDALASNGRIHIVDINDEGGKQCAELQSDEAYEYKKFAPFNAAHGTHITMNFTPVGNRIAQCGVSAFVTNTDSMTDQVEARQIDSNFAQEVHAELHAMRQARPGMVIAAQVSTLPPRVTTYSVAQTIADIDALMDGSADQPDNIHVFFGGRGSLHDNDIDGVPEADEFIQVLNHYR